MVAYIKHTVWRFVKYDPVLFKLLDVRYSVMKNLVLGDCKHLIRFILFGDEENERKNDPIYIPRNITWPEEKFLNDDDLDHKYEKIKDNELTIGNNLEL